MKILLVEDEKAIALPLKAGLEKLGFIVEWAEDGEVAIDMYYDNTYDLILLDLNLPKCDGIEVLKTIRSENNEIKILILSARSSVTDKVQGLDEGANDYLAKPFHFREVEERIRALLRRDFATKNTILESGNLSCDTAAKQVLVDDKPIDLTKKEFSILHYLLLNQGRCISSEELIEHVWDSETDAFTTAVKVHVNALRKKLPKDFIRTIRGQGYYVD